MQDRAAALGAFCPPAAGPAAHLEGAVVLAHEVLKGLGEGFALLGHLLPPLLLRPLRLRLP